MINSDQMYPLYIEDRPSDNMLASILDDEAEDSDYTPNIEVHLNGKYEPSLDCIAKEYHEL